MPRDALYLADIVAAAGSIAHFLDGVEKAEFLASDLLQSAVLQKLSIIGEAATRLTPELKAAHADIPWKPVIGFRNIAVHAYFTIDWERLWDTAMIDVPALVPLVTQIQQGLAE